MVRIILSEVYVIYELPLYPGEITPSFVSMSHIPHNSHYSVLCLQCRMFKQQAGGGGCFDSHLYPRNMLTGIACQASESACPRINITVITKGLQQVLFALFKQQIYSKIQNMP